MLNAPPSRYRIVEKDGRLIVYDHGVQVSLGALSASKPGQSPSALNPMKAEAPKPNVLPGSFLATETIFDKVGMALVSLMSKGTNEAGLTTIETRIKQGSRETIRTAQLNADQVKRLARGLAQLLAIPLAIFLGIISGSSGVSLIILLFASPVIILALISLVPLLTSLKWEKA